MSQTQTQDVTADTETMTDTLEELKELRQALQHKKDMALINEQSEKHNQLKEKVEKVDDDIARVEHLMKTNYDTLTEADQREAIATGLEAAADGYDNISFDPTSNLKTDLQRKWHGMGNEANAHIRLFRGDDRKDLTKAIYGHMDAIIFNHETPGDERLSVETLRRAAAELRALDN